MIIFPVGYASTPGLRSKTLFLEIAVEDLLMS